MLTARGKTRNTCLLSVYFPGAAACPGGNDSDTMIWLQVIKNNCLFLFPFRVAEIGQTSGFYPGVFCFDG